MWYYSHDPYEIIIFGQLWARITLKKLRPNKYQIYISSFIKLSEAMKTKATINPKILLQRKPKRALLLSPCMGSDPLWWVMTWKPGGRDLWELYNNAGVFTIFTLPGPLIIPWHIQYLSLQHRGRRRAHTAGSFRYVLPDYLSLDKIGIDCVHPLGY